MNSKFINQIFWPVFSYASGTILNLYFKESCSLSLSHALCSALPSPLCSQHLHACQHSSRRPNSALPTSFLIKAVTPFKMMPQHLYKTFPDLWSHAEVTFIWICPKILWGVAKIDHKLPIPVCSLFCNVTLPLILSRGGPLDFSTC